MIDCTAEIDCYLKRLFPITRSITGEGNRETLRILQELIPLELIEYPSGSQVYDWTIPKEWRIRDAWIKNSRGEKIIDFKNSNIHVVSYSAPVQGSMTFSELKDHLHFREDLPEAIPYRTSYYTENWGFCLSYNDFKSYFRDDEEYEVCIDSTLFNGSLTIGELVIPGRSPQEFLISTYICHPSLANDNLSGVVLTAFLARELLSRDLNYSYRIIFVPETIGAIAYCAMNETVMKKISSGLVVTTTGGRDVYCYKQSYDASHPINGIIESAFRENGISFQKRAFDIHGSDERQYSSLGFRINMATISKDKYYEYPYYHTSLDNLTFVTAESINATLQIYNSVLRKYEMNLCYRNLKPHCEVMLSRHGLYPGTGGALNPLGSDTELLDATLWLLFYCDGSVNLYDVSEKTGLNISVLYSCAEKLVENGILERVA